jgi:2-oxoglutarate ferredoxin oxidoreductase subunit beta
MVERQDYSNDVQPAWCPGCGNFGLWNGMKRALAELDLPPHRVLMVSGIGQASKLPDYVNVNAYTSLHGRPIPIAEGAHLVNHEMKVIVHAGDGDTYGIGGNHLMHLLRRNIDITLIIHDNRVYGLTKGQYSPTSPKGFETTTSPPPRGALEQPINPVAIALASDATFVARAFVGEAGHMAEMFKAAIEHKGSALVDVFQPCVVFNRRYGFDYYRPRVYKLDEEEGYDPSDREAAWRKAHEDEDEAGVAIGIFYQDKERPTYEEQLSVLEAGALVEQPFRDWSEEDYQDLENELT